MPPETVTAINDAIFAHRKIEAIKIYREATGQGLKESKDFIESLTDQLRAEVPEKFGPEPSGIGCAGTMLMLAFLAVLSAVGIFQPI